MYTVYQVVQVDKDGEYVHTEWQTEQRAIDEAAKLDKEAEDGVRFVVRGYQRGF